MKNTLALVGVAVAAALSIGHSTNASAADPPSRGDATPARGFADSDAEAAPERAKLRGATSAFTAKLKPAVTKDARAKPLAAQIVEALKIKDRAARKAKLDSLGSQILAVRSDALKTSGIDVKEAEAKVPAAVNANVVRVLPPATNNSGNNNGPVVVTSSSFPATSTAKNECPDSNDTWDFDGSKVKVNAKSTPVDDDCTSIRAGRKTTIQIPAGSKRVSVSASAVLDIDVFAAAFGVFAKSAGYWGMFIVAPSGATLGTLQVGGQNINVNFKKCELKRITAKNYIPLPIPFDTASFSDTVQEGDPNSTCSVDLPSNVGSSLEITLYAGGSVDADLTGVATVSADITPKSVKATFTK